MLYLYTGVLYKMPLILLKTEKKRNLWNFKGLNRVVYVTLKRKTKRYSVLFIFLIKTWKF